MRCPASFREFRWLGIMDSFSKLYDAVLYAPIERAIVKYSDVCSLGYKQVSSCEEAFAILYELVAYALITMV